MIFSLSLKLPRFGLVISIADQSGIISRSSEFFFGKRMIDDSSYELNLPSNTEHPRLYLDPLLRCDRVCYPDIR